MVYKSTMENNNNDNMDKFSKVSRHAQAVVAHLERFHQDDPETTNSHSESKRFEVGEIPELETPTVEVYAPKFQELVGRTPLVDLTCILGPPETVPDNVKLVAKLEFLNPGLSAKDRLAWSILQSAVADGELHFGMTVITELDLNFGDNDTTSAVAMVCAMLGCKCEIVVPPESSSETKKKIQALESHGAVIVQPGTEATSGETKQNKLCDFAKGLAAAKPDQYFYFDRYEKAVNANAYYDTLGPEIWKQTKGMVTHFVSSGYTGGTISGVGRFFKEASKGQIQLDLAVANNHNDNDSIIGKSVSELSMDIPTQTVDVSDCEAMRMCHQLARSQGLLCGPVSGMNVAAALKVAQTLIEKEHRKEGTSNKDKAPIIICTVLPDNGIKYLDTLFNACWIKASYGIELEAIEPLNRQFKESSSSFEKLQAFRVVDIIGETPLIDLTHYVNNVNDCKARLLAKVEFFNPGFSIKDRIVRNIFTTAEKNGVLQPGMTVVAASSGNTGAATAMMCAIRGYKCIITTSQKCSQEKMDAIRAYGAELLVSPPGAQEGDENHYMNMAKNMAKTNPDWFDVDQYQNPYNPEAHCLTLGPEIWEQTNGKITHFIAAGSTGGTVCGTTRCLKERNPNIRSVLADPVGSIFTEYFHKRTHGKPGKFLVEGVGKGSIPGCMDIDVIDEVLPVKDCQAFRMCSKMAREEGILAGGSAGLNVFAGIVLANRLTTSGIVVTVLPDSGIKYQSKVYCREWLETNQVL